MKNKKEVRIMDKNRIAEIVEKAKNGDNDAFVQLFELTQHKAYYTAIKITKKPEDAQDILQDSYVKAFTTLKLLKDNSKFQSWFNCIVANNCKNYVVKKKPNLFSEYENDNENYAFEDTLENQDKSLLPHEVTDNEETKRIVMQCVEKLPEDQKICILMFYYDEMSIKEIAQALEISEGTIKSRLSLAKKKLKKEFEKLEENGTKLHAIPFIPLMRYALDTDSKMIFSTNFNTGTIKKSVLKELKSNHTLSSAKSVFAKSIVHKVVTSVLACIVTATAVTSAVIAFNNRENNTKDALRTTPYEIESSIPNEETDNYFINGEFAVFDKDKKHIFYLSDNSINVKDYNGSNSKQIFGGKAENLVYKDKLYFVSGGKLYSYSDDKAEELFDVISDYIYCTKDYFIGINKNKSKSYIIDLSDKSEENIEIKGSNITFNNDYLYYRGANQNIYRISPSTLNNVETVVNYGDDYNISLPYHIIKNTVYYSQFDSDETGNIYYSDIESSNVSKIKLLSGVTDFSVTDNSIYYADIEGDLYRCDKNGSNQVLIAKGDFGYSASVNDYQIWHNTNTDKSYIITNGESSFYKELNGCITSAQIINSDMYYTAGSHIYHTEINGKAGD